MIRHSKGHCVGLKTLTHVNLPGIPVALNKFVFYFNYFQKISKKKNLKIFDIFRAEEKFILLKNIKAEYWSQK